MPPAEIDEGLLRCQGCARTYPIRCGIPILLREPLADGELAGLSMPPVEPEVLAEQAAPGPDSAPLPHQLESLGAYLDAAWGDCVTPPAEGPGAGFGFAALEEKLRARASAPVARALELGCSVGRGLAALRLGAELVVGLDRSVAALRLASRILRGESVAFARRMIGRTYARAEIRAGAHAASDVQFICADVLEPPFAPRGFERVAALNLLDSVSSPRALLHHANQLCAPAGEILLSSPYAWRSGVTLEEERFGGDDPAAAVIREGVALGWTIEETHARVRWTLRRDARAASLYDVHWLRARLPSQR